VIIVGFPFSFRGLLYNVAGVFNNGKLLSIVPKTYLPNYNEFKEKIYFQPALNSTFSINLDQFSYPITFGKHQIFINEQDQKLVFGIEICEDLWAVAPPSGKLALQGAILIFNLSASNEIIGKIQFRRQLIQQQSQRLISAYCYVSSGIGESTMDMVFGGYGAIYENGKCLGELERYSNNSSSLSYDIDYELLQNARIRNNVWGDGKQNSSQGFNEVSFSTKCINYETEDLLRKIPQFPFLPIYDGRSKLDYRCEEIISIQSSGLAMRFQRSKAKKLVIGLSGGLDSTHALLICIEALKMLVLPNDRLFALTMPGFGTTEKTRNNVISLCKAFGIKLKTISIIKSVKLHLSEIDHSKEDITFENAQARERTQILFDISNKIQGIVIGTGDLSEIALGWCTFNGDHMSSYNVNASVPKTLIQHLIKWYIDFKVQNNDIKEILQNILETPISPELLPAKDGQISQKTEEQIGPFELHDFFLFYFIRHRFRAKKILFLAKKAFEGKYQEETIKKWLKLFIQRFFTNQFKRSSLPDGPRVGTVSLSPRSEWRMPSDASSNDWLKDLND